MPERRAATNNVRATSTGAPQLIAGSHARRPLRAQHKSDPKSNPAGLEPAIFGSEDQRLTGPALPQGETCNFRARLALRTLTPNSLGPFALRTFNF